MTGPTRRLSLVEFVALMAMTSATIAFSTDAMLPALPEIGRELSADSPNSVQLIIVAFIFGMGLGTMFMGPLSDALGRKAVMLFGLALYCLGAALAVYAPTLETLLAARVLQGFGASAPRVTAQAMIRDLYSGRGQARVTSFVMMTFSLVPAIAPLLGAFIIGGFGWRGVFWAFIVFAVICGTWLGLRQPETLPPERRRPLEFARLRSAVVEVLAHSNVRRAIMLQTLIFGMLFGTISSIQPIYEVTFDRADTFPYWFGVVAILASGTAFLNARLVGRFGMVLLLQWALGLFLILTIVVGALLAANILPKALYFPLFFIWQVGSFSLIGMTIGNVMAVAMQPMGHIAGMAASVISAISTISAVAVAAPIGLAFDGTPLPLMLSVAVCAAASLFLARGLFEDTGEAPVRPAG